MPLNSSMTYVIVIDLVRLQLNTTFLPIWQRFVTVEMSSGVIYRHGFRLPGQNPVDDILLAAKHREREMSW